MSSLTLRTAIKNYITSQNPSYELYDLTDHYDSRNFPNQDDFLAIDFVASDEALVQLPDCYREEGRINIALMYKKKKDIGAKLTAIESIRAQFRGERVGNILIENVGTPKTGNDAIKFPGSYTSVLFYIDYYFDFEKG